MKIVAFSLLIAFHFNSFSQNVGIGTITPVEKLEVKNPLRSTVKISSNNFVDTTELLLSNRNSSNSGTDFSLKSIREEGLFFSSLSDLPANTSSNSLVIRPNGNIGIGTVPSYKFHVNGQSRFNGLTQIDGLNLLEFGAGVAGKELNAGKIGYNAFGHSALTIVGAGTNATNRAVYFFAEGGTTMNGPLNIEGPLRVNGNAGSSGQVLTSNGTGDPTWANSAYGNDIRFAFRIEESLASINNFGRFTATRYNTNTAEVIPGATSVTINRSGIYHFDILLSASVGLTAAPTSSPQFYLGFYNGLASPFVINNFKIMQAASSTVYRMDETYSLEIYVQAPANISFFHNLTLGGASLSSFQIEGHIIGHLVNE